MPSIFPDTTLGGVVVRTAAGAATGVSGVANAYVPPATFTMNCPETAYSSVNCASNRFSVDQINAMASEMLALAVRMNPSGTWNCAATNNLSVAFASFGVTNTLTDAFGVPL